MRNTRCGITITEVVVVLALVVLLIILLFPAAQTSRESARQANCRSNLRQLGLAIQNYESTHRIWPPGACFGVSWEVAILPQIDRSDLFQLADYSQYSQGDSKSSWAQLRSTAIGLYLCPADPASPFFRSGELTIAATSYLGNSGRGVLVNGLDGMFRHVHPGVYGYEDGPIRTADVTDGLSTTAAVSEVLHSVGGLPRDRLRIVWQLPHGFSKSDIDQFRDACRSVPRDPPSHGWGGNPMHHGFDWTEGDVGSSTYNHMLRPMEPSCSNGSGWQDGIFSAASAHPQMTNVLFADGHVQSFTTQVDDAIWFGIGSRNGSESISP